MYERAPQHVDLLLLGSSGAALYNAPLRLAAPYFASLGVAGPAGGWSEAALLELAATPGAASSMLSSQVLPAPSTAAASPEMLLGLQSFHAHACIVALGDGTARLTRAVTHAQGLAEAWTERSVDPWWRKATTAGSGGGATAETPSGGAQPLLLAGECPSSPDGEQLVPIAAAALAGVLHQGYRKYGEVCGTSASLHALFCSCW